MVSSLHSLVLSDIIPVAPFEARSEKWSGRSDDRCEMKTKLLDLVQFTMRSWLIKEVFRFEGNTVLGEGVANAILKNTGRNRQHRWKYCAQQWIYKYDPENTGSNRRRSWKYCARRRRLFVIFTLGTRSIVVHLQGRDAFFVKLTEHQNAVLMQLD